MVRNMTCNRCEDYENHCELLDNWLASLSGDLSVRTDDIYIMGLWTKMLKEEIIAKHLLQFGKDLLVALDIAAWEYDLAVTLRFYKAIPPKFRNYGISRMISQMSKPISSFSQLKYAQKFGINTESDLEIIFKELGWSRKTKGVEFHHLIEQRFASNPEVIAWLGPNTKEWKCIVVAKGTAEHTPKFTTPWREAIPYANDRPGPNGLSTISASLDDIKKALRKVYKEYPEILKALGL